MDFLFNSLAAPDPASPPPEPETAGSASSPPADAGGGGGWGFGGLLKTLTSQSETVLEAYRRDLAEFSTGLRRETDAFREAAARAARDLPSSAHALDGLADIVAQGKDAIAQAAAAASSSTASAASDGGADSEPSSASGHLRHYSRFEAQLRALQSDPATFTADPEDAEDFAAWRAGFSVEERQDGRLAALLPGGGGPAGLLLPPRLHRRRLRALRRRPRRGLRRPRRRPAPRAGSHWVRDPRRHARSRADVPRLGLRREPPAQRHRGV